MSTVRACPTCTQINPAGSVVCMACGAELAAAARRRPKATELSIDLGRLESEEDTVPAVHLDAPELQRWVDSGPDALEANSAVPELTLRSVDALPVLEDVADETETLPRGVVARSDGEPATGKASVAKAARRAAVRRNRLSGHQRVAGAAATPTDVLVLERDTAAREALCGLLETFGFRAHPAQTPVQAVRLLDAKHFAAAFLDLVFDGPQQRASVDLCQRIKAEVHVALGRPAAVIIVSSSSRPVERVRATLAGCDAFLVQPMTRGGVAQALEACSVALPADSRGS